jgi:hypothetical protein
MAAWMDGATVTVEIAFTNAPLTANASCTWVDVSADVRAMNIRRGRQTELSGYSVGTMQLTLNNRARAYDPSNTAGAYYGNLLPMRKVRVTATSGATTATIFTGHILGWPLEYPGMIDATVVIGCVDAFRPLAQMSPPSNAFDAEVLTDSPHGYWRLDTIDNGGISPASAGNVDARNFNRGDTNFSDPADLTITRPVGVDTTLANAGWVVENFPTAAPKAIEGWFWNLQQGIYGGTNIARAALDSTNWIRLAIGSTDGTISVGYSNSTDNRYFTFASTGWKIEQSSAHLVLTASATTLTLWLNGVDIWSATLSVGTSTNTFAALPPPSMQAVVQPRAGSTVSPAVYGLAVYSSALSSTRIGKHYLAGLTGWGHPLGDRAGDRIGRILDAVGWPAADRALSTGSTVLGVYGSDGSTLGALQQIADTEQGLLFVDGSGNVVLRDRQWQWTNSSATTSQATFGDSGSETPYADIEIDGNHLDYIRNVVTVTYTGSSVTVKDATSVSAYGEQSDSIAASALPASDGFVARQLAAFRLRLRKDAKTRVPMVKVLPRVKTSTHLPTLLGLELGERVTVKRRPSGGTGIIDQTCTVQGISHQITPDRWTTLLYLAPAQPSYTEGPYLTLGDATYGRIGSSSGGSPFTANKIPY